jgi:hypothetical protein
MRLVIERKPSKKGWVAYDHGKGRPVAPKNVGNSKRTAVEATTRDAAIAAYLNAKGFTPANFVAENQEA